MFAIMLSALAAAASPASPTAGATPRPAPAAPVAAERRYCVETTNTGSRIPKRECHTRGDWMKQGFDPLAPE